MKAEYKRLFDKFNRDMNGVPGPISDYIEALGEVIEELESSREIAQEDNVG
jgi:hypothetical protein